MKLTYPELKIWPEDMEKLRQFSVGHAPTNSMKASGPGNWEMHIRADFTETIGVYTFYVELCIENYGGVQDWETGDDPVPDTLIEIHRTFPILEFGPEKVIFRDEEKGKARLEFSEAHGKEKRVWSEDDDD